MPHKKKLLIVSLSAGAGHFRAAEAIKKTTEKYFPAIEATHIDMADYMTTAMKNATIRSYELMVKKIPELWGFIYQKTNESPSTNNRFQQLTGFLNRLNAQPLFDLISETKPDAIICTHFLPANAIAEGIRKGLFSVAVSIVMTDYDQHELLMLPGMDHYFVSSDKMRAKMIRHGIDARHITISGIPVDPVFYESKSVASLRKFHGANPAVPTVLLLSGGYGLSKIDEIVTVLFALQKPIQLFVVAGKNKRLETKLRTLQPPNHIQLTVVGWTDGMDEYMRVADVVVSKPGGLTTTECITLQKPLIAVQPIPGQEKENSDYILAEGYGVVATSPEDLLYYLESNTYLPKRKPAYSKTNAGKTILETVSKLM